MQGGSTVTREGWVVLDCVRGVLEAQKVLLPREQGTILKDFHPENLVLAVLHVPTSLDTGHKSLLP